MPQEPHRPVPRRRQLPEEANQAAAADLAEAMAAGDLRYPIAGRYPLEEIAAAHEAAEQAGATGRIVIDL